MGAPPPKMKTRGRDRRTGKTMERRKYCRRCGNMLIPFPPERPPVGIIDKLLKRFIFTGPYNPHKFDRICEECRRPEWSNPRML